MSKLYLTGIMILTIVFCGAMYASSNSQKGTNDDFHHQIDAFHDLAKQEDLLVESWRLRVKSEKVEGDLHEEIATFERQFSDYKRQPTEKSNDHLSVTFVKDNENAPREELKWFATETPNGHLIEKTYELISENERGHVNQTELKNRLKELGFHFQSSLLFYQLTAKADDLPLEQLTDEAERFVNELGAKKVEALSEKTFVSLSAYHEKWNHRISLHDQKEMNMQIALRQNPDLGSGTTVTFGTPIITTEY